MARPWQSKLQAAVADLERLSVAMVLNCQEVGEHASCGPGLLSCTGFTYNPDTLQQHNIGYCHVAWPDMGVPDLAHMLRIVQLMHKVVHCDGKKVAVHCHAGLGRTGLVIACYMVFSLGFSAVQAILKVRDRRRGALQTQAQEMFVLVFAKWIQHLRCCVHAAGVHTTSTIPKLWDDHLRVCCTRNMLSNANLSQALPPKTLDELIVRQKLVMHGRMRQHYWNVPELLLNILLVSKFCNWILVLPHLMCQNSMLYANGAVPVISHHGSSSCCPYSCVWRPQGICSKLHSLSMAQMENDSLVDTFAHVCIHLMLPEDPTEVSKLALLRAKLRKPSCQGACILEHLTTCWHKFLCDQADRLCTRLNHQLAGYNWSPTNAVGETTSAASASMLHTVARMVHSTWMLGGTLDATENSGDFLVPGIGTSSHP